MAMDIEQELYDMFGGNTGDSLSDLLFNLYREGLQGQVSVTTFQSEKPQKPRTEKQCDERRDRSRQVSEGVEKSDRRRLCRMSTQDMASEETKKERREIEEWQQKAAQVSQGNRTSTTMFKCGKCGKRETTYFQLQTRR